MLACKGMWISIAKEPYIFVIFQGGGGVERLDTVSAQHQVTLRQECTLRQTSKLNMFEYVCSVHYFAFLFNTFLLCV